LKKPGWGYGRDDGATWPQQLGQSSGNNEKSGVSVVADERSNRLIVRGDDLFRKKIRNLVEKLDTPSTSRGTTKVLRLSHADATKVSELLSNLMGEVTGEETEGKTGVSVFADEGLNALVVRAEPSRMNEIEFIVNQLDVRRAQVLIEAAIVEISDQAGRDLGVQWATGDRSGGSTPVAGTNFNNVGVSLGQVLGSIQSEEVIAPAIGATLAAGEEDSSGISWGFSYRLCPPPARLTCSPPLDHYPGQRRGRDHGGSERALPYRSDHQHQ